MESKRELIGKIKMENLVKLEDLTEENLTKIFKEYFQDPQLKLKVVSGKKNFLSQNDQFQSDIKKWELLITRDGQEKQISFIAKTTAESSFQKFNTRIARQFFTETFWYKYAFPVLKKEFPELASF